MRCVWCNVSDQNPDWMVIGCPAPDGDGHLFSVPEPPVVEPLTPTPLQRLLNKVNKVTAPWRHGKRIDPKAMDELVARQIEIEERQQEPPQTMPLEDIVAFLQKSDALDVRYSHEVLAKIIQPLTRQHNNLTSDQNVGEVVTVSREDLYGVAKAWRLRVARARVLDDSNLLTLVEAVHALIQSRVWGR